MKRKYFLALFLAVLFMAMAVWEIYVDYYASREAIRIITTFQLDKVAHLVGGAFIVGLVLLVYPEAHALGVFLITIVGALSWEIFELVFDSKVAYFFAKERELWLRDFSGDLAAGILGAVLFFVLWRRIFS